MNDPSAGASKISSRILNSLSSQESSNFKNQHVHCNCTKNAGSNIERNTCGQIPFAASTDAEEYKIVPLSGKPHFTCILTKSHVQRPFQMVIPRQAHGFLPSSVMRCILTRGKNTWEMQYIGNIPGRRFGSGWRKFAVDNKLKTGDACVFELMGTDNILNFRVQILDGQLPFDCDAERGQSLDAPIVIS